MSQGNLKSMFTNYINQDSVFRNKDALTTNWKPENILHRDKQINNLASILAPALRGDDPSNVFIYGSVGTGKCVHPDTTILTKKGPKSIKKIFEDSDRDQTIEKNGEEIVKPKNSINVVTYNDKIQQEVKEVEALYRQESPDKMYKLKTGSGREVTSTGNHSFLKIKQKGAIDFHTAKDLQEGDYVGLPGTNSVESTVEHREDDFMSKLCRFSGYIVGDGGIHNYGDYRISLTNENKDIRDDFVQISEEMFGVQARIRKPEERTDSVVFSSKQAYEMLEELGTETNVVAGGKQIPNFVSGLSINHKAEFLSAVMDTDGHFSNKQSEMVYTTKSKQLANQLSYLLLDFNITARISQKQVDGETYHRVKISGAENFRKLVEAGVCPKIEHKKKRLNKYAEKESNTNVSLVPFSGDNIREIRKRSRMEAQEIEPGSPTTVHYYENEEAFISKDKLSEYLENVKKRLDEIKQLTEEKNFETARKLRKKLHIEWNECAEEIDENHMNIRYAVKNDGGRIDEFREEFVNLVHGKAEGVLNDKVLSQKIDFLDRLTDENVVWDKIESKQEVESDTEYVYDIEVQDNHNYVCGKGGLISHNTLITKHVTSELHDVASAEEADLNIVYINCKMKKVADTEYRLLAKLAKQLGDDVPSTGLPTDEVYNRFFNALQEQKGVVIIALDEIDALVKKVGDEFLYNLTRINDDLDSTKVSIIGISNDLNFTEYMDSRVKSSLSEEEIIFPPYNAIELREILKERAERGFVEDTLVDGVISKCSALAAQEHGDARRALDLIRVAGELSERSSDTEVKKEHVDMAQDKIERDRIVETVRSQPKHSKLVLYTILEMTDEDDEIATGDVYSEYKELCGKTEVSELTQRRVSGLISELDMLGVINAKVISKGRYGRTRQISIDLSENIQNQIKDIVEEKFYL